MVFAVIVNVVANSQ